MKLVVIHAYEKNHQYKQLVFNIFLRNIQQYKIYDVNITLLSIGYRNRTTLLGVEAFKLQPHRPTRVDPT